MEDWPRLAGGTLLIGLEAPVLDATTARRIAGIAPAGVILFARNLRSPGETRELLAACARALPEGRPALFAIDQEGGRVSRLEAWVGPTPSAARLARAGAPSTRAFAAATGRAVAALGFNVDFAPVVDLCEAETMNGIGDRSFGNDPRTVTAHARAFLEGLASAGVAGTLKHFPGLGATSVDSHESLPIAHREPAELDRADLVPFRELAPLAPSIMVGHAHYPALDEVAGRPASLSPPIVQGLLRGRLGFRGLVVTDDLEMGAVAPLDVDGAAAVAAIEAGCDLLLYCRRLERAEAAVAALAARAARDRVFAERLVQAERAVARFARSWPVPAPDLVAWETARLGLIEAATAV